jgi:hypothetical protein
VVAGLAASLPQASEGREAGGSLLGNRFAALADDGADDVDDGSDVEDASVDASTALAMEASRVHQAFEDADSKRYTDSENAVARNLAAQLDQGCEIAIAQDTEELGDYQSTQQRQLPPRVPLSPDSFAPPLLTPAPPTSPPVPSHASSSTRRPRSGRSRSRSRSRHKTGLLPAPSPLDASAQPWEGPPCLTSMWVGEWLCTFWARPCPGGWSAPSFLGSGS